MEDRAKSQAPRPVTELPQTPQPRSAPEAPEPPPPPQGGRRVDDAEVRKHWRAVEFAVSDRSGEGGDKLVEIAIGGQAPVPGTPLTIQVLNLLPDFRMGQESLTTRSMEDRNPAAKIVILEGAKQLFEGWSFRDHPGQHAFEDSRYTVRMTRALPAGG